MIQFRLNISIILFLLSSLIPSALGAQELVKRKSSTLSKMQTLFIFNFAKYAEWPQGSVGDTFRIGVHQNQELFDQLSVAAETREINDKPVRVSNLHDLDNADEFQMLYADNRNGVTANELFAAIADAPVLLVTEGYDYNSTMINFVRVGERLQFQLNNANVEAQGLVISNTLGKLAIEVKSEADWKKLLEQARAELGEERDKSRQLEADNKELNTEVDRLNVELVDLQNQKEELQKSISIQKSELDEIYNRIGAQRDVYQDLVKSLNEKESALNESQQVLEQKNQEIEHKELEVAQAERKLKNQLLQLDDAISQNAEIEAKMKATTRLLENANQLNIIGFIVILIIAGLAILAFVNFRKQRTQAQTIAVQKDEMQHQRDEIHQQHIVLEEKNNEILDSISYAKRIQTAILPPDRIVKEYLQNSFILYKPKDVVAGDFYWMESVSYSPPSQGGVLRGAEGGGFLTNQPPRPESVRDTPPSKGGEEDIVFFAAADCTGHGVPGAMVSVICNNGLNRSVREFGLREPGEILDKTRELVIQEFEKSEEEVKDGMDISLCALNTKTRELKWAGANNPLWIVQRSEIKDQSEGDLDPGSLNLELHEVKANKQPIGKYDLAEPFTTHTIELNEGDTIYIFSDGYPDQFGGDNGKKYKSGKFKRTLLDLAQKPISEQRELLDKEFESWRGSLEQIDDVCVIGVKV